MPSLTATRRRALQRRNQGDAVVDDEQFEDLDLDIDTDKHKNKNRKKQQQQQPEGYSEEDIVFDRKTARKSRNSAVGDDDLINNNNADAVYDDEDILAVQPRDAHHDAREGVRGAFGRGAGSKHKKDAAGRRKDLFGDADDDQDDEGADEATLATLMSRKERQRLADEDFDLGGGLAGGTLEPEQYPVDEEGLGGKKLGGDSTLMQVDSVAGQFAALSASDRFQLIKAQSPEVERLIAELQQYLAEIRSVFPPLRSALFERSKALKRGGAAAADSMLLEFLETKVQLMLGYCMHIFFYLLLKVEGQQVQGHPVLKRLLELRVYLEKLHPVEQRLQHSITRLLSGDSAGGVASASATGAGQARLGKLRPVQDAASGGDGGRYVARKTAPVIDELRQRRKQEAVADEIRALEKEEERTMQRKRLTRAEAAKYSGALEQVPLDAQMQEEEEDQFLTSATSFIGAAKKNKKGTLAGDDVGDDDDAAASGLSLIEKLRKARAAAQGATNTAAAAGAADSSAAVSRVDLVSGGSNSKRLQKDRKKRALEERRVEQDEFDDDQDDGGGDDEGDVLDFEELAAEQEEREQEDRAMKKHRAENPYEEPEKARRNIDRDIQKHRGLTKARPKDRKNPRANQRRKFTAGMRVAKAQSRAVDGSNRSDSANVPLKTHVTHSRKF